jgi:hypothetical protein
MISPKALHAIIKHFDCIDTAVAARMMRKRPWLEPALTSFLCDLLDEDVQNETSLEYSLEELNRDLKLDDNLIKTNFQIETHEYAPDIERWVTQSDLGFIINYNDYLLPENSWSTAWLFQAKRMTADHKGQYLYSESSRFGSHDAKQHKRIESLIKIVGVEFVKYMLYCPKPASLDPLVRGKLAHLRNGSLSNDIFDFALGLELRDELLSGGGTLAAGVFISNVNDLPGNLGKVHRNILGSCWPLSWFIARHFTNDRNRGHLREDIDHSNKIKISPGGRVTISTKNLPNGAEWAHGIVRGDRASVQRVVQALNATQEIAYQFLPAHTMTVDISVGSDFNADFRRINLE